MKDGMRLLLLSILERQGKNFYSGLSGLIRQISKCFVLSLLLEELLFS
jgi:hypothetical protein